jgi:hypothetical protein
MITTNEVFNTIDICLEGIKPSKHMQKVEDRIAVFDLHRRSLEIIASTKDDKLLEYKQFLHEAEASKTLLSRLSRKLVVLSKFLLEVVTNYMSTGKLVIKWYQYPKVVVMLYSFLKEIVAA